MQSGGEIGKKAFLREDNSGSSFSAGTNCNALGVPPLLALEVDVLELSRDTVRENALSISRSSSLVSPFRKAMVKPADPPY